MDNLTMKIEVIDNASMKVDKVSKRFENAGKKMESLGSRINVLGQRLTLSATVPLLFFGRNAIQTALDVESAWTRFRKVFSGTEEDVANLVKTGKTLSEKFGTKVEDVAGVMGEFNKAGVQSTDAIKKLTESAMETSILFDTDLKGAFDGVKSIMFGFGLSTKKTAEALAAINTVADTTTTSEKDILDVLERSGAAFEQYNVSITDAAALTSLLAQSNIKGAIAGNSFKTILAKIGDTTPKAAKELRQFGIDTHSVEFKTMSFTDKLKLFGKKQEEIFATKNKKKIADWNTALKDTVGIRQANRFSILVNKIDQFDGVVKNASDPIKNLKRWNTQLSKVLESQPNKVEILNQKYRNQKVILGKELIPLKIKLLETLTKLIEWYNRLSPKTKDMIVKFGLIAIVMGPVLAYFGILVTTVGFLSQAIKMLTIKALVPLLTKFGLISESAGALATGLSVGLLLAIAAVTTYIVKKAYDAFEGLQQDIEDVKNSVKNAKERLEEFQKTVGNLSTEKANENLQKAIDKGNELADTADKITDRYKGLPGVFHAVWDQSKDWIDKLLKKMDKIISKSSEAKGKSHNFGGVVEKFNSGGIVYAANGYLARGRDTVPAMLSPGEMVLNKTQQSNLFNLLSGRLQPRTAEGVVVNINVGTMVATPGEQREFARKIEELISENNNRR